ncbi:MAG: polysaccharide biosynthesis protein [Planctomycetota bacterium]|nr:MAG: polysaccharide biosynthesis protein [Planctomycetota bacterium]
MTAGQLYSHDQYGDQSPATIPMRAAFPSRQTDRCEPLPPPDATELDTPVSVISPLPRSARWLRHRIAAILPIYLLTFSACYAAAIELRFDFEVPQAFREVFWITLPLILIVKFAACWLTAEWRRTFRHVTVLDLVFIGAGTLGAGVFLGLLNGLLPAAIKIPRSVLLVDGALSLLSLTTLRFAYRVWMEILSPVLMRRKLRSRTLIYGVDSQSIGILQMTIAMHSAGLPFRVVGFVSDSARRHTSLIAGVPVHHPERGWSAIREASHARDLLIPSSVPGRVVRAILRECSEADIQVHIIPTVEEMVGGRFKLASRDVTVSDLLRRDPNRLDMESIRHYVTGQRVMVTGGAGSIGSELCRQLLALDPELLVIYDQSEFGVFTMEQEFARHEGDRVRYYVADILDERMLDQVMSTHQPQIVFHAAAYKHVPLMEDNPQAAITNNILGTKAIADAAHRHQVQRFVQISTDKAVRPTSVMGATKLVAEKYIQSLSRHAGTQFITVRFGNVLNSMGSVVPTFRKQIEAGGPITVTHPDMQRFFMTIPEAVQLVLQAGAIGSTGDVLILDMGDPVRIVDLARDMIMLSGLRFPDDIDIEFTGLRPGEKLYEELFYESETGAEKIHEKIFRGTSEQAPTVLQINSQIVQLTEAAQGNQQSALRTLQKIVIGYSGQEWKPARLRAAG